MKLLWGTGLVCYIEKAIFPAFFFLESCCKIDLVIRYLPFSVNVLISVHPVYLCFYPMLDMDAMFYGVWPSKICIIMFCSILSLSLSPPSSQSLSLSQSLSSFLYPFLPSSTLSLSLSHILNLSLPHTLNFSLPSSTTFFLLQLPISLFFPSSPILSISLSLPLPSSQSLSLPLPLFQLSPSLSLPSTRSLSLSFMSPSLTLSIYLLLYFHLQSATFIWLCMWLGCLMCHCVCYSVW